jgi:hypothetical protein
MLKFELGQKVWFIVDYESKQVDWATISSRSYEDWDNNGVAYIEKTYWVNVTECFKEQELYSSEIEARLQFMKG